MVADCPAAFTVTERPELLYEQALDNPMALTVHEPPPPNEMVAEYPLELVPDHVVPASPPALLEWCPVSEECPPRELPDPEEEPLLPVRDAVPPDPEPDSLDFDANVPALWPESPPDDPGALAAPDADELGPDAAADESAEAGSPTPVDA